MRLLAEYPSFLVAKRLKMIFMASLSSSKRLSFSKSTYFCMHVLHEIACKTITQLLQITDEDVICDKRRKKRSPLECQRSGPRGSRKENRGFFSPKNLMHVILLDLKSASQSSQSCDIRKTNGQLPKDLGKFSASGQKDKQGPNQPET